MCNANILHKQSIGAIFYFFMQVTRHTRPEGHFKVWATLFSLAMVYLIGQEPYPGSSQKLWWVIPVRDPCSCTKLQLGGMNTITPYRPFIFHPLLLLLSSLAMVCLIGQEPDPGSSQQLRWVIPVIDPCSCTELQLGGMNTITPYRPFNVNYFDDINLGDIKQWLNCSSKFLNRLYFKYCLKLFLHGGDKKEETICRNQ